MTLPLSPASASQRHRTAPRRARTRARAAALAAVLGLSAVLTACGSGTSSTTPTPVAAPSSAETAPAGLERYYSQELTWYPCTSADGIAKDTSSKASSKLTCTTVTVPLDYSQPDGATITIALKKRAADGTSIGTLFVNPGGPGGSGVDLISSVEGYFSSDLLSSYDVVGFDPRGVGASTAVDCLTDAELDAERSGADETPISSETSADAARTDVADYATWLRGKCDAATSTEGLIDRIDTVSAARDLDVLRAATGQSSLTYLGYSYGTYLGATYAELFPERVGRLVLDGAIDPTLSAGELTLGQAKGFERALRVYVEDCQSGSKCPLSGGVDAGVQQIRDLLESTRTAPLETSDPNRFLTYDLAESAILGVLYQSESWYVLTEALTQAMQQKDGSTLLRIADLFASRSSDGSYSGNGDEVIGAINCLDYPVEGDAASWDEEAAQLKEASPTFGEDLAYSDLYCKAWGSTSTRERSEIHADGAAPILVVGTTGDPATPYAWAKALASQLSSGHLLTWEGEGHTAYGRAGQCVTTAVDDYLLSGTLPQEGLTCSG